MTREYDQTLARDRLAASATLAFGVFGLLLATLGVYGVMAFGVADRRAEIATRIALGAERSRILALVLRGGLRLTAVGLAAGIGLSVLVTRTLARFVAEVHGAEPGFWRPRPSPSWPRHCSPRTCRPAVPRPRSRLPPCAATRALFCSLWRRPSGLRIGAHAAALKGCATACRQCSRPASTRIPASERSDAPRGPPHDASERSEASHAHGARRRSGARERV